MVSKTGILQLLGLSTLAVLFVVGNITLEGRKGSSLSLE